MKNKENKKQVAVVSDEIVVDCRDVDLAREAAMKHSKGDPRVEQTLKVNDNELLTTDPQK